MHPKNAKNPYKSAKKQIYYRKIDVDKTTIDEKTREVLVTFSTETPVPQYDGFEILDHSPDSVRLDRIKDGGAVLVEHDRHDHIGSVQQASITKDRRGAAILRIGSSERAEEVFQDIKDHIKTKISVGYIVHKAIEDGQTENGDPIYRAIDWEPIEISFCAIQADPNCGVMRDLQPRKSTQLNSNSMNNRLFKGDAMNIDNQKLSRKQRREARRALDDGNQGQGEGGMFADVLKAGKRYEDQGGLTVAETIIRDGGDIDDFNKRMLAVISDSKNGNHDQLGMPDMSFINKRQYSIREAILSMSGDRSAGGYEREVSQELKRQLGKKTTSMLLPLGVMKREITAGGDGSSMIATDHLSGSFIDAVAARSVVMGLNPTILNGLVGDVAIPRESGSTADWYTLDGTDTIAEGDPALDQVLMSPKTVAGLSSFSHMMLTQSSPDIEMMIRNSLAKAVGTAFDKAALVGAGGKSPLGISGQNGVAVDTYTGSPTFAHLVAMEGAIAGNDVDLSHLAYVTTSAMAATLKTIDVGVDTGRFIWEGNGKEAGQGIVNTFPATYTNNMLAGKVLFGNWSDLILGFWGVISLDVDTSTGFNKGTTAVRAILDADVAVRHPESFALLESDV